MENTTFIHGSEFFSLGLPSAFCPLPYFQVRGGLFLFLWDCATLLVLEIAYSTKILYCKGIVSYRQRGDNTRQQNCRLRDGRLRR
jgi:hypothetical protein